MQSAKVIDGDHHQCDSLGGPVSDEAEMKCKNSYDKDSSNLRSMQCEVRLVSEDTKTFNCLSATLCEEAVDRWDDLAPLPKDVKPMTSTITWRATNDKSYYYPRVARLTDSKFMVCSHTFRSGECRVIEMVGSNLQLGDPTALSLEWVSPFKGSFLNLADDKLLGCGDSKCAIITVKGRDITQGPVMHIPWKDIKVEHYRFQNLWNRVQVSQNKILGATKWYNHEAKKYAYGIALLTLKDDDSVAVSASLTLALDVEPFIYIGLPDLEVLSPGTVVTCYNAVAGDNKASCKVFTVIEDTILVGQTLEIPLKSFQDKRDEYLISRLVRMNPQEVLFCYQHTHGWGCWLLKASGPTLSNLEIASEVSIPVKNKDGQYYRANGDAVRLWTNRAVLCFNRHGGYPLAGCMVITCEDSKCSADESLIGTRLDAVTKHQVDFVGADTLAPGKIAACVPDLKGDWGRHDPLCEVYTFPDQAN